METNYFFNSKYINTYIYKKNVLLNSFCSSILLQLESSNLQDGGTFVSKLPTFKTLFAFVVLTLFKLPDPGTSIYVQSLLKFPTWSGQGRSKSPRRPVVPSLGHNIDSCITTVKVNAKPTKITQIRYVESQKRQYTTTEVGLHLF